MTIRLSAVLTFLAFCVVFGLLIEAGRWADLLVDAVMWLVFGGASAYAIARLVRGLPHTSDQTIGLPAAVRRWIHGESANR